MHEVLVNRLGGLSLPKKSVVRLTDRPDMTLGVYRGRKTTQQQEHQPLAGLNLNRVYPILESVKNGIFQSKCLAQFSFLRIYS